MVGATGIEPVTPAMSTQAQQRNPLILQKLTAPSIYLCTTNVLRTFSSTGSMNQRALCFEAEFLLCARYSTYAAAPGSWAGSGTFRLNLTFSSIALSPAPTRQDGFPMVGPTIQDGSLLFVPTVTVRYTTGKGVTN